MIEKKTNLKYTTTTCRKPLILLGLLDFCRLLQKGHPVWTADPVSITILCQDRLTHIRTGQIVCKISSTTAEIVSYTFRSGIHL